ncbi:MAG: quinone-dependent dihydroorotate dehydrogenase [Alphaproteobacteria bacterium]|nr:MAG: quinone-dependent dihydroorotate dehydrogenase [Alphaproteobacteria bacterium]
MSLYSLIRPILMKMDAEKAHRMTISLLKTGLGPRYAFTDPVLETTLWGRKFKNPLGLAAGFDKDAEVIPAMFNMGFGFVEAGTVTPRPQDGNPKPRVFRDEKNKSVINRMGFPGKGLSYFADNVESYREKYGPSQGIFGVNIGMNKDAPSPADDYRTGIVRLAPLADYITVNVSSPNTQGLRDLQRRDDLDRLLGALVEARNGTSAKPPLLLKVAPDLDAPQRQAIAEVALRHGIDGLIVSNTTVTRPAQLSAPLREEKGGLSGQLLTSLSTGVIGDFYTLTKGVIPVIGAGGIGSAEDAYAKICAGASLVQVYTALVFEGPGLISQILEGLAAMLKRDKFGTIADAVGSAHASGKRQAKAVS